MYPFLIPAFSAIPPQLETTIDLDLVFFNAGAFICAGFVLDYGADRFIDHTVIVAKRLHVNQTLIALLTAGAEWEELAVVIAAVAQGKPSLAFGNIIGSCISNILGAFSLGLLFRPFSQFDHSAKIYSLLQLVVTASVSISLISAGPVKMGKTGGGILVTCFIIYFLSIAWSIYRGIMDAPEGENDGDSFESGSESEQSLSNSTSSISALDAPFLPTHEPTEDVIQVPPSASHGFSDTGERHLRYHTAQIIIGFLALSLSGYILSHSAASLSSLLGLSESVMGLTILAFTTTLPEKFISLISGSRGHSGILVATTAGSNIFLLTLCIGVALLGSDTSQLSQEILIIEEILFLCASAAVFALVVWFGTKRWIGALMLAGYVTFIALEFTIWRR